MKALTLIFISFLFFGAGYAVCPPGTIDDGSGNCIPDTGGGGGGGGGGSGTASIQITEALTSLCTLIKNVLAVAMMFMVVASALVYSIGQVMGAETRARASVWATSMFNGAIIGALIYLLVPFVLRKMLENQVDIQMCFILF